MLIKIYKEMDRGKILVYFMYLLGDENLIYVAYYFASLNVIHIKMAL